MVRRSKLEMWLDILSTIKSGKSKPTRIMYGANVSWEALQRILGSMASRGLVREIDTRNVRKRDKRTTRRYEITQKGENIIRYFKRTRGLLGLEISTIRR